MLVISRNVEEEVYFVVRGITIRMKLIEARPNKVRLAIDAPQEVRIYRRENYLAMIEDETKEERCQKPESVEKAS